MSSEGDMPSLRLEVRAADQSGFDPHSNPLLPFRVELIEKYESYRDVIFL
jgi:hypothetical protein